MNFRPAFVMLSMTLALAACGEMPFGKSEPETPAHSGPPTVSPLDQPIQTSDEGRAVSTAEAATMNTAIFRARGNEPGWIVTAADKTAVLERQGAKSVGIPVRRMTYSRGVEFVGVMNGRPFSLNVQAGQCTDSMSGEKFPFTARVSANGQRMTGCAGPTDTMPKAQTTASAGTTTKRKAAPKAAAPAAPKAAETTPAATTATENKATEDKAADDKATDSTTATTPETTTGNSATSTGSATTGTTSGSTSATDSETTGSATTGSSTTGTESSGSNTGTTGTGTTSTGSTGSTSTGSGSTTTQSPAIPPLPPMPGQPLDSTE